LKLLDFFLAKTPRRKGLQIILYHLI